MWMVSQDVKTERGFRVEGLQNGSRSRINATSLLFKRQAEITNAKAKGGWIKIDNESQKAALTSLNWVTVTVPGPWHVGRQSLATWGFCRCLTRTSTHPYPSVLFPAVANGS